MLALLQDARLLVPVVAVLGEVEVDEQGLAHDKSSDMAAVLVQAADGSSGLLAFTSTDLDGPVGPAGPAGAGAAATAATAAVQDGAEALLVDLAGPASYVVDGRRPDPARGRVAAGRHRRRLAAVSGLDWPLDGMIR